MPFPSPGDLPNPEVEFTSPAWQADSLPLSRVRIPNKLYIYIYKLKKENKHFTFHIVKKYRDKVKDSFSDFGAFCIFSIVACLFTELESPS